MIGISNLQLLPNGDILGMIFENRLAVYTPYLKKLNRLKLPNIKFKLRISGFATHKISENNFGVMVAFEDYHKRDCLIYYTLKKSKNSGKY